MKVILIVISAWSHGAWTIHQEFETNESCIRTAQKIEQEVGDWTTVNMCIKQDTGTIQNFE